MAFLLYKAKADLDYLAKSLQTHCCGDINLASLVLWKLDEAKGKSSVAKKALGLFSTECDRNKEIFLAIQSGKVKKEDAFDRAVERYRLSKRLR